MTSPLKAELAGIQATLDASLQREREANERIATLTAERDALRAAKDAAYSERNQCVALAARMAVALGLRAGVAVHPEDDVEWESDWRTLVFVELPAGQASWHFHDSEGALLDGLPVFAGQWDGHNGAEKYARVSASRFADVAADLAARMSQLNEARAATVDCNMALMEMAGAVATEREACAQVANNFRRANRTGNAIAAAIRNRGNE